MVGTLGKAVGHEHIEHIGIGEAHTFVATHFALFQLILHLRLSEVQCHRAWLGIFQVQVHEQIVGRIETYETVDNYTRIVSGNTGHITNALTIDHKL